MTFREHERNNTYQESLAFHSGASSSYKSVKINRKMDSCTINLHITLSLSNTNQDLVERQAWKTKMKQNVSYFCSLVTDLDPATPLSNPVNIYIKYCVLISRSLIYMEAIPILGRALKVPHHLRDAFEVFVNSTNLTFLTFLYKIGIKLS